ncbi:MAG: thermonuclease family protein [Sphingomonas sp.]|uniref:thermonuclease family protein n=1 Tax=Sphingomonas sp. TaxID=28214 RepID=UPI0017E64E25|nr:thermonuclease family protein [Sphingomonas sp.]MBA3666743.1 thermonuclease family protein [Sphingomonas sp.]
MGKLLPFRRRRRWTRPKDFGAPGPKLRFWPEDDRVTLRGVARETVEWLGKLRPFILGAILLSAWPTLDPALVEPPGFLSADPERVNDHFTRCGPGRGHACVIDGDTIKIGQRKVRIIGIDTPETHPARCAEEARLGEAATAELQRLLNQGAFDMTGRVFNDHDRYGRDLRAITRRRADGSIQSIADDMRASGLARRYLGGFKVGWC